ncbi:COLC2 protein, partial [Bombycilla garrulus]|nr:COLC2 protein [Bombycilla garrulus]
EPAFGAFQPSHYSPEPFQPLQLCSNPGLAASSPGSADLPSPWNSSCSPPQLSPLTPSPLSAPDTKPYSWPGEEWPCPPCPFPSAACCCPACSGPAMDSRLLPAFPRPGTDCSELPLGLPEDFCRRDRSWDICYS